MRLFIALPLPEDARQQAEHYVSALRAAGVRGSFSRRENLHLTLAFLGEQPDTAAARRAMDALCMEPFSFSLERRGSFSGREGETLYLAPGRPGALPELEAALRRALVREGIGPEERSFVPHLTLGRRVRSFGPAAAEITPPRLRIYARELILYRSHRPEGILTYSPEYCRKLGENVRA